MNNIDFVQLRKIQDNMIHRIVLKDGFKKLDLFCGCDVSYQEENAFIAFVTLNKYFFHFFSIDLAPPKLRDLRVNHFL